MEAIFEYISKYWFAFLFGIIAIIFIAIIIILQLKNSFYEKHKYVKAEIEKSKDFKKYNITEVDPDTLEEINSRKE